MIGLKISAKKFVEQRKKFVIELRDLIYQRATLNKQIRNVQREMNSWDNALAGSTVKEE